MVRTSRAVLVGALVSSFIALLAFIGGVTVALRWGSSLPLVAAAGSASTAQGTTPAEVKDDFRVFWEVWSLVDSKFYHTEPLDYGKMTYGAIEGMLKSLEDDYTFFEEPRATEQTRERMSGEVEGIGAYLEFRDNKLLILSPIEESPAEKAGLLAGDQIIKVDDRDMAPIVEGLSSTEAARKAATFIRGPKGTTVKLTIVRAATNETLEVSIVRDAVPLISVRSYLLDGNIAYVQVSEFKETTTGELDKVLNKALAQKPAGLILDLRNNPGGLLESAREMLGRFVPDGMALKEEFSDGKTSEMEIIRNSGAADALDIPMVVLVNSGSASASEIVAGALRDHQRATLLGEKTFGKGSVQSIEPLSDGSSARITIAHWLTPNGTEIHKKGIEPDHYVPFLQDDQYLITFPPGRPTDPESVKDSQLWWALKVLDSQERPSFPLPTPTPGADATAAPAETAQPEATSAP
ncbi:MAG TPA: S41 family peptidase [Herpetosiphonaceae bacterium]